LQVFPTDAHDWRILFAEVPGKLKELRARGSKIVFITNQAGIARGKLREEDFMLKAENICKRLGTPLQLICSTNEGGFFRRVFLGF
jgi:bifunctional polynucleotide phosphatase/kinase